MKDKIGRNKMSKIVVIGAGGMLGYAVSEYFERNSYSVVRINREKFDITKNNILNLSSVIDNAEAVINCAGVIKPRIASMSIEDVLKVNSVFPRNLATLANKMGVKCFHITTDCVYSGFKGNYDEEDFHDAEDLYGLSKSGGDKADCMVLRTSIIGEENNQARSLLEWAKSERGGVLNGFINHYWNGVTTLHLAETIEMILKNDLYHKEVFHIHSPNTVTKYDLLRIFNDVYELNIKINPVQSNTFCDRSLKSKYRLSTQFCRKSVEEQVEQMRDFFEAAYYRNAVVNL
jgi:dTDP-4-dehydrorhamnose reductase